MRTTLGAALMVAILLGGCSAPMETGTTTAPTTPSLPPAGPTTFYHSFGAEPVDASLLQGNNTAFFAMGGYNSIGAVTFEPTIGITSSGNIFVPSLKRVGPGGGTIAFDQGTHIMRGTDSGRNWTDVGPFLGPTDTSRIPNSNDPFLYVDPWTDRIIKFDMCLTLSGFCMEYSDDDGATWNFIGVATGEGPALDHQSLAAAPPTGSTATVGYPNVLVFCVNRGPNAAGAWCSTSLDGGIGWTPLLPGFPIGEPQCIGVHGHIHGAADGTFYRGSLSCAGAAVYRSTDSGFTWTQHEIPDATIRGHDVEVATDAAGNVYAFWIGADGLPYLAASTDRGDTWGTPHMVAAPGVTATGFPAVSAGDAGRVAFAYIGSTVPDGYEGKQDNATWNGYIGVLTDALSEQPLLTTVAVNDPEDPLSKGRCGDIRCGGFGDFIDLAIDPTGRPWAAFAHNVHGRMGVVGTFLEGPSLRGPLAALPPLQLPGPASLNATD